MTVVRDTSTEALVDRASTLLSEYLNGGRRRPDLLRDAAENIVELRAQSTLKDGRTDWSGWSTGYRRAASEIYRRAGVPKDQLNSVQTALRYHVQNLIRERAPEHELDAVGLDTISPKARLTRDRETLVALAATVAPRGKPLDVLRLISYAETLVGMVEPLDVAKLDDLERRGFRLVARAVRERLDTLIESAGDAEAGAGAP